MAIRCGYTVGRTTTESSLADQLKKYRVKEVKSEETKKPGIARAPNPAHEKLVDKCIRVVSIWVLLAPAMSRREPSAGLFRCEAPRS